MGTGLPRLGPPLMRCLARVGRVNDLVPHLDRGYIYCAGGPQRSFSSLPQQKQHLSNLQPTNLSTMPKKTKQQQQQQPQLHQEDSMPSLEDELLADVSLSAPDVTEESATDDPLPISPTPVSPVMAPSARKRVRLSKRDIPDYKFTEEQLQDIANFVQSHPELYDKRNKSYANPKAKEQLWMTLADQFPDCTHQQVKKEVDKKRTDFGKIEKREHKSGAAARDRTPREEKIVQDWGFLSGHIVHEQTQPSETFGTLPDEGDSSGRESVLSAASLQRRKKLRGQQEPTSPRQPKDPVLADLLETAQYLTNRPRRQPTTQHEADARLFVEYLYSRIVRVSPVHHSLLFNKLSSIISLLEEPVAASTRVKEGRQLLESLSLPAYPGQSSMQATWLPPHAAPPPPPPATPGPSYQAGPSYTVPAPAPQYQTIQYHQAAYAPPTHYYTQAFPQPQQQPAPPTTTQQQFQSSLAPEIQPSPKMPWSMDSPVKYQTLQPPTTKQRMKTPTKKKTPMSPMLQTPQMFLEEEDQ